MSDVKYFFIFNLVFSILVFSQKLSAQIDEDWADKIDSVGLLMDKLTKEKDDTRIYQMNKRIVQLMNEVLADPISFTYEFEELDKMSKLVSSDKAIRVYTWNIPLNTGNYMFGGYVQVSLKKKKFAVYELVDKSDSLVEPDQVDLTADYWFGALYYEMVTNKYKGKKFYTLLGWDGNTPFTNRKVVEVLTFDAKGQPKFGFPFKYEKKRGRRILFEYAEQATMALRFDKDMNMIVWDHISPSDPKLEGQYQYYGPDFSYDGIFFHKGKWNYRADLDARNSKDPSFNRKLEYSP